VNGYRNEKEKQDLFNWNLVTKTILHVDEWVKVFEEVRYHGDYSSLILN
jgi:hypothetical protein